MAKRLGSLRGRLVAIAIAIVLVVAAYVLLWRNSEVEGHLVGSEPTAMIGSGSSAVAVAADGTILTWLPPPEDESLPALPLEAPPESGRLAGPMLEQARVLGAAPAALRPYLRESYYGESGVDVLLTSGVELRFGEATQASRKWRTVAAVLASPTVTSLDYVDVHAPSHPAIRGSGHTLPAIP